MTQVNVAPTIVQSGSHWQQYDAYKDSGVAWLGKIPAHWELERLKVSVAACQNGLWGDEPNGMDDDIACVRVADFDRLTHRVPSTEFTVRSIPAGQRVGRILRRGDLLIEKSGGGELQPVGTVVLYDLDLPAVCSNFIARLTVKNGYHASFLCYLHAALYSLRVNTRSIKQNTGIQNLDSDSYLDERVGFPPLPEQRAIAAFLDRETAHLDAIVAAKERLICLLQEKRAALINRAVTRGLDPDAVMKDSGIAWLGEIPAHWEVKRIKSITFEHKQGYYTEQEYVNEGVKLARITDIDDNATVAFDSMPYVTIRPEHERAFELRDGDFLFARSGTIGRFGVVHNPDRSVFASYLIRFRFHGAEPGFLRYTFGSPYFKQTLVSTLHGGANQNVHAENVKDQLIALPSVAEQCAVAAYLDRETAELDTLVDRIRAHIEKVGEYRTALISAAVTGKIDVCDQEAANE